MHHDTIEIRRLALPCHIGVPEHERTTAQTLHATIRLIPHQGFQTMRDRIEATIDYDQLTQELKSLAAAKPRKLIETLAEDIASHILSRHPVRHVSVSIEKRILPDTDCVAVHIEREV
jgi:dihydroneopterin aldolase